MKNARDDMLKLLATALLAVCAASTGMVGWYISVLTDEVRGLRTEVNRLSVAVEVQAGGNPFAKEKLE